MWVVCPRREGPPRRLEHSSWTRRGTQQVMLAKRLTSVQVSPCIQSLPLQAEDDKDRHKAWLMLTTAAMW